MLSYVFDSAEDYCVLWGKEDLNLIDNFRVVTMMECIHKVHCQEEVTRMPEYSLVC